MNGQYLGSSEGRTTGAVERETEGSAAQFHVKDLENTILKTQSKILKPTMEHLHTMLRTLLGQITSAGPRQRMAVSLQSMAKHQEQKTAATGERTSTENF